MKISCSTFTFYYWKCIYFIACIPPIASFFISLTRKTDDVTAQLCDENHVGMRKILSQLKIPKFKCNPTNFIHRQKEHAHACTKMCFFISYPLPVLIDAGG